MNNLALVIEGIDCVANVGYEDTSLFFVKDGLKLKYVLNDLVISRPTKYMKLKFHRLTLKSDDSIDNLQKIEFNFTRTSEVLALWGAPEIPGMDSWHAYFLRGLNGVISTIKELGGNQLGHGHQPFNPLDGSLKPEYQPAL